MKRILLTLGFSITALFALTNCAQELEDPNLGNRQFVQPGTPYTISASIQGGVTELTAQEGNSVVTSPDTKTTCTNGVMVWETGDQLGVFYSPDVTDQKDRKYSSCRIFTTNNPSSGSFSGTIDETELALGNTNTWYAYYPYNSHVNTLNGQSGYLTIGSYKDKAQTQDGKANSVPAGLAGHNCPLWGVVYSSTKSDVLPSFKMEQMCTGLRVKVENKTNENIPISTISVRVPGKHLVGNFFPNFIGKEGFKLIPRTNNTSDEVRLDITHAVLSPNETGYFHIACAPFTVNQGEVIRVKVNNALKEQTLNKTINYSAGVIRDINFSLNVLPNEIVIPWLEDFSAFINQDDMMAKYPQSTNTEWKKSDYYAGGAKPEIMISKGGTNKFVATISVDGFNSGDYLSLSFKSNHPEHLDISGNICQNIVKKTDTYYELRLGTIPSDKKLILTFTNNSTSDNVRLDDIQLTRRLSVPTSMSFAKSKIVVLPNEKVETQLVQGAPTKVTYSSDNNKIAYVDSNTGSISLNGGIGKATITATSESSLTYAPGQANYEIVVNPVTLEIPNGVYVIEYPSVDGVKRLMSGHISANGKYLQSVTPQDFNAHFAGTTYQTSDRSILWTLSKNTLNGLYNLSNNEQEQAGHKFLQHTDQGFSFVSSFLTATGFMLSDNPTSQEFTYDYNLSYYTVNASDGQRTIMNYVDGQGYAMRPGENEKSVIKLIKAEYAEIPSIIFEQTSFSPLATDTSLDVPYIANEYVSWNQVKVKVISGDWITLLSPNDGYIHLEFSQNDTGISREAQVEVSYPDAVPTVITITQSFKSSASKALLTEVDLTPTKGNAYGNLVTINAADGYEWQHTGYVDSQKYPCIQLRKFKSTSKPGGIITLPTFGSNIKSIKFFVTGSGSNDYNTGSAPTSGELNFQTSNTDSASAPAVLSTPKADGTTKELVMDFTGKSYNTGYIRATAGFRIWRIEVTL